MIWGNQKYLDIINELETYIRKLQAHIKEQDERIKELESEVAHLKKDSGNSSKPPSSDIINPKVNKTKEAKNGTRGKIGGQKGHKKHERLPFSAGEIDNTFTQTLEKCPCCGGELELTNKPPKKVQQIEIAPKPFYVNEYACNVYWCENCQSYHTAPVPPEARSGLFVRPAWAVTWR
ncbi:hypothetical protein FACS1894137_17380 [Spirochaetia bacterium]|nr:hypothetical protein FACS1894137_17380 [Spirochaetia bacterium]